MTDARVIPHHSKAKFHPFSSKRRMNRRFFTPHPAKKGACSTPTEATLGNPCKEGGRQGQTNHSVGRGGGRKGGEEGRSSSRKQITHNLEHFVIVNQVRRNSSEGEKGE